MKLELNKMYVLRNGEIDTITRTTSMLDRPFCSEGGRMYTEDGHCGYMNQESIHDIMEEYVPKGKTKNA